VAIFSDLHLGIHNQSPEWLERSREWAGWFSSLIKSRKIQTVFSLGDFFHTSQPISEETMYSAKRILSLFHPASITMILGNHCRNISVWEIDSPFSPALDFTNLTIIKSPQKMTSHGKSFFLAPWPCHLRQIQPCDVILGHFNIENFKPSHDEVCFSGLKPHELSRLASVIFSGHFHLRSEETVEKCKIVYVGNPYPFYPNDAWSQKGVYILNIESLDYEFVPSQIQNPYVQLSNPQPA